MVRPGKVLSAWILMLAAAAPAFAQQGGTVVGGGATINQPDSQTTIVNQTTDRAIINWNQFNIDAGSIVRFLQPGTSSVILNRVIGGDASSILGSLEANGNVYLLNPNGILFGNGSQINVNGFMASTLALSDTNFMSGNIHLMQDPNHALSYVINQGTINASGFAALVAPLVENSGSITATAGTIYLLGSSEAMLMFNNNKMIGYSIGSVYGGTVHLPSGVLSNAVRAVVNTSTLVEAGGVVDDGSGTIHLLGTGGTVVNTGSLSVNGLASTAGGMLVINSSQATASLASSLFTADGQGINSNGGQIRLLSNRNTYFNGHIYARGGDPGNGGFIEVSGANNLYFIGSADATAANGTGGSLLIDPATITIINGAGGTLDANLAADGQILAGDIDVGLNTLSEAQLQAMAGGMNLTIQATNQIIFNDLTTDNTLTLATTGAFTVTFAQTNVASGSGITMSDPTNDAITTAGGRVTMTQASTSAQMQIGRIITNNGNITLTAGSNILAYILNAGTGTMILQADSDANGVGVLQQWNISASRLFTAGNLIMRAADGIYSSSGTTTPILTAAGRIQAGNTGPAGTTANTIHISNTGAVALADNIGAGVLGYAIRNDSTGLVSIVSSGTMTIGANVTVTGTAASTLSSTGGALTQTAGIISVPNLIARSATGMTLNNLNYAAGAAQLNLQNTVSGNISITNNSANQLTLSNLLGGFSVSNTVGSTSITTTGTLVANSNMTCTGQTLTLSSLTSTVNHTGGTLSANNLVMSASTGINLSATTTVNILSAVNTTGTFNITSNTSVPMTINSISNTGGTITINGSGGIVVNGNINSGANQTYLQTSTNAITQTAGVITSASLRLRGQTGVQINNFTSTSLEVLNGGTGTIVITKPAGALSLDSLGSGFAVSNAGGNVTIQTPGVLTITSAINNSGFTTTLTSTATNINQTAGTITATNLTTNAATGITLTSVAPTVFSATNSTSGNIAVTGTGALTALAVTNTGGGSISLTCTTGNLSITNVTANGGGTITLTATAGNILDADSDTGTTRITTTGVINLSAPAGTIGATGGTVNGYLDIASGFSAASAWSAQSGVFVSLTGIATLNTSALPTITVTNVGGTIGIANVTALGNIVVNSALFSAMNDNLELSAFGALTVNAGQSISTSAGGVTLNASGVLTVSGSVTAATTVTLRADSAFTGSDNVGNLTGAGSVTAPNLVASAATGISLTNTSVTNLQAVVNTTSGAIVVTNTAGMTVTAVTNTGGGAVTLTCSSGNMTILNVTANGAGAITLNATTGSLLDDSSQATMITTTGSITLNAVAGSIGSFNGANFNDSIDFATGVGSVNGTAALNMYVSQVGAAGALTSGQVGAFNSTGIGSVQSVVNLVGDFNITDAEFAGVQDDHFVLGASGNLNVNSAILTTGNVTLLAAGNVAIGAGVTGATVTFGADSALLGSDNAGLISQSAGTVTATNLVLSAATGITLNNMAVTNLQATNAAGGAITLSTTGTLTLANLGAGYSILNSNGTVSITTTGNLTVASNVVSSGAMTLTSTAGSLGSTGGTISAATLTLNSATGMSLSGIAAPAITATNSASGTLALSGVSSFTLNAITNNFGNISISNSGGILVAGLMTSSGSITIASGGIFEQTAVGSDITAAGSVSVTAGADVRLGAINAGGAGMTIESTGGSILDNNDAGSPVLNLATPGNITMTAAGTVGSSSNAIEIQAGGTASIGAGGVSNGVSINLSGTTATNDLIITFAPPNGLIQWNGIARLSSLENTFGSIDFFLDVLRRRSDPRIHNTLQDDDTTRDEGVQRKARKSRVLKR